MAEIENAEDEAPALASATEKSGLSSDNGPGKEPENDANGPVNEKNGDGASPGEKQNNVAGDVEQKEVDLGSAQASGGQEAKFGGAEEEGNANNEAEKKENGDADDDSDDDPFGGLDDVASMDIYDLSNYTFGKKNEESGSKAMRQLSKMDMLQALENSYNERGMRRSVGGVILVHSHNFPHVLLLQRSDGKGEFALPGGRLRPGESDEEGLKRKLAAKLRPPPSTAGEEDHELEIGEKLCNWYAIDFKRRYYPYVPAHVTKPKEELHVYTVVLPSKFMFSVPKNLQLVAVPLFELFNNPTTYGDVISAIPALLSRWHINFC